MTDREKLLEILSVPIYMREGADPAEAVADFLIDNDVRPVVRCKDCRHSYEDIGGLVCGHGICVDCLVREDFFCADGVKREGSKP